MDEVTIPAKVMLIGEYGVVDGGPALLCALKPGFFFQKRLKVDEPHPDSPLGKYLVQSAQFVSFEKRGAGLGPGFGSSTAELIAGASLVHGKLPELAPLWRWYKEQFPEASGADLAVQLQAMRTGFSFYRVQGNETQAISSSPIFGQILLFSSLPELKVKTHEALKKKRPKLFNPKTSAWVDQVSAALREGSPNDLAALNDFADYLAEHDLETERAKTIRKTFLKDSSVLAAKGCGAGLNDVFIVVKKTPEEADSNIRVVARGQGLTYLGTLKEHLW